MAARSLHRGTHSSQSNRLARGGRPGLVRGAEPESGGEERKQGSEREHMRSPAYYSCTDGAADETGGMDG